MDPAIQSFCHSLRGPRGPSSPPPSFKHRDHLSHAEEDELMQAKEVTSSPVPIGRLLGPGWVLLVIFVRLGDTALFV
jgi:hypothetical protein